MGEVSIELYSNHIPTFRDQDEHYSEMVLTKLILFFLTHSDMWKNKRDYKRKF